MEFDDALMPYFSEIQEFRSAWYRAVWVAPDLRSIVTYCEGDVILVMYPTRKDYDNAFAEALEFYSTH